MSRIEANESQRLLVSQVDPGSNAFSNNEQIIQSFLKNGTLFIQSRGLSRESEIALGLGEPMQTSAADQNKVSVFAPDFQLNETKPWFIYPQCVSMSAGDFLDTLHHITGSKVSQSVGLGHSFLSSKREYESDFNQTQNKINTNEIVKAVPVARKTFENHPSPVQIASILNNLVHRLIAANQEDCELLPQIGFGFWTETEGMIGLTPEVLFEIDHKKVRTMALAGTRNRFGPDVPLDLNPKELAEHQIVVEGILEKLKKFGVPKLGAAREVKLLDLIHLCTEMELELEAMPSFESLVSLLHPTPALGAWPAIASKNWIATYRGNALRGRHGAPFSVRFPGDRLMTCVVAIRNLQWTLLGSQITAGAGIVKGSNLESEWSEIALKMGSVEKLLLQ